MLEVTIPNIELFDEESEEFLLLKGQKLTLEHSLVSISKWESKWCKSFFTKDAKTEEESIDYIRCMTITQNVDERIYKYIPDKIIQEITNYIDAPMTATTINTGKNNTNREIITSELIYYWMITFNVPMKCEKWHLNRLLTLINVCNIKTNPPKKMSKKELVERNRALNLARRNELNTKG